MAELKIQMILDLKPFSAGLASALNMGKSFSSQFTKIASGIQVDVDESAFKNEISKLENIYAGFRQSAEKDVKLDADGKKVRTEGKKAEDAIKKVPAKKTTFFFGNAKHLTDTIASAGIAIGAITMAAKKVIGVLGSWTTASNRQEQAEKKVTQAILSTGNAAGFTAPKLAKAASELQKITTFSDEFILNNATAQLLTFTNIAGDNFLRVQKAALDVSTVLSTGPEDAMNRLSGISIQLGKALNDPVANLSALSRSGIQFSKEQKEVIKHLADTNRLADAQALILDELEKQYGGQAEAAAKGGGATQQFANIVGDLKEKLGDLIKVALIPAVTFLSRFVSGINDMISIGKKSSTNLEDQRIKASALKSEFDSLTQTLLILSQKESLSNEELKIKNDTIQKLQTQYPLYFSNLKNEAGNYDTLKTSIENARIQLENYTNQIVQNAIVQQYADRIADLTTKIIQNRTTVAELEIANSKLRNTFSTNTEDVTANRIAMENNNTMIAAATAMNADLTLELGNVQKALQLAKEEAAKYTNAIGPAAVQVLDDGIKTTAETAETTATVMKNGFITNLFDMKIAALDLAENIKLNFEITFDMMLEHWGNVASQWAARAEATAQAINQTVNNVGNAYNAFFEHKKQLIQNDMNREIASAQARYNAEKKRIQNTVQDEDEKAAQLAQLEQTLADETANIKEDARQKEILAARKLKPIKIAQAISGTALAVVNALQMKPFIPLGIASAIAAGVAGAAQIATIKAQPFASGGKVRGGEQTIRVNEQGEEYVINAPATRILGAGLLSKIMAFPGRAKQALETIAFPSVNIPQPKYAFAYGGSTASVNENIDYNARLNVDLQGIKESIKEIKEAILGIYLTAELDDEKLAVMVENGQKQLTLRTVG